ncbi:MAG: c-type cytochrome [Proteobacteria bacterium]|nr:c-type cytochrome [Pseudomonadota bacterium]
MRLISGVVLALGLGLLVPPGIMAAEDEYAAIRDKLKACFACHGVNGAPQDPQFPIIAGQHLYYIYVQLKDFSSGLRISPLMTEIVTGLSVEEMLLKNFQAGRPGSPEMTGVAGGLTKEEMLLFAKFFSEQEWPYIGYRADPEKAKKGEIATVAGQCVQCHRGGYEGGSRIPRLAGQYPAYLEKTMLDFKSKERHNSPAKSSLMRSYSEDDIAAMAEYLGGM